MRFLILLALLGARCMPGQPLDWRPVMRDALARMIESDTRLADYTFDRTITRKEFDASGRLKQQTVTVLRPERINGIWVSRAVSRDGRPLTATEIQRQEESIRRRIAEGQAQGARSTSIMGRDTEELIKEFPEALDYRLAGEETSAGRKLWVLECTPRPGYRPPNLRARLFEKVRGRVWVDQDSKDLVRVESEVFDTISLGFGILGRIEKGTRFTLHRAPVREGHYFTESSRVKFSAKVLLVKSLFSEISTSYTNFKPRTGVQEKP
jgi:hypothetical protein